MALQQNRQWRRWMQKQKQKTQKKKKVALGLARFCSGRVGYFGRGGRSGPFPRVPTQLANRMLTDVPGISFLTEDVHFWYAALSRLLQGQSRVRHNLDLEEPGPELARHEEPPGLGIPGDAVEHVGRLQALRSCICRCLVSI
mmetsp:Transcript_162659/g.521528  ORF Transcript_162659/g.521528 Transcript_162659/m.521528 type:complete len:142 (-) Transcript_162659:946-1371(-)